MTRGDVFAAHEAHVGVVNERLASLIRPFGGVLGQRLQVTAFRGRIVGIVGNVANGPPGQPVEPELYLPAPALLAKVLLVRTVDDHGTQILRERLAALSPGRDVIMRGLQDYADERVAPQRVRARIFVSLAAFATVAGSLGLAGALWMIVHSRRRECALRLALGAPLSSVIAVVRRDVALSAGLGLCCGVAAGVTIATAAKRAFMASGGIEWSALVSVAVVLCGMACLVSVRPIRTLASLNPIATLRDD
jgi:ABC-type lipoprotein release transport system permease subunit